METPGWSPGELLAVVQAGRQREQRTAFFLHIHARLCCEAFNGKLSPGYEAFPLWSQEEIFSMKAERLRNALFQQSK